MIAVIFEVTPKSDKREEYLDIAGELKSMLSEMAGFISIERFQSLSNPNNMLSLSFWEDEKSVMSWRKQEQHRKAQLKGRNDIFSHYRLRVADVLRDYGMNERAQAPADSQP